MCALRDTSLQCTTGSAAGGALAAWVHSRVRSAAGGDQAAWVHNRVRSRLLSAQQNVIQNAIGAQQGLLPMLSGLPGCALKHAAHTALAALP